MSWFFVLTIIFSHRFYHAQNSSNSSSSSVISSSSSSVISSASSSGMSSASSSGMSSASSSAMSSSAMSSSSMPSSNTPSSNTPHCAFSDCKSCFESINGSCTWDFALPGCVNSTGTILLPYPFETENATKDYCDMTDCFSEFQNGMVHYKAVQDKWDWDNRVNMTNFAVCLNAGGDVNCIGTHWDDGNYSAMCTSNKTNAEVCSYANTYSWTSTNRLSLPMRLRLLLSNSSSSMSSSSTMSSSGPISSSPMSSSSTMSSSGPISSTSPMSSSSAMSSSAMSSSTMSSNIPSSSGMGSQVHFKQNYCFPSKCTGAFGKSPKMFDIIFTKETNFTLPSDVVSKPDYTCASSGGGGNSLSTGAIIGIVVGVIVGLLLLGFLGFNMCRNKDDSGFQAM